MHINELTQLLNIDQLWSTITPIIVQASENNILTYNILHITLTYLKQVPNAGIVRVPVVKGDFLSLADHVQQFIAENVSSNI